MDSLSKKGSHLKKNAEFTFHFSTPPHAPPLLALVSLLNILTSSLLLYAFLAIVTTLAFHQSTEKEPCL